jgi:hypothetical protein
MSCRSRRAVEEDVVGMGGMGQGDSTPAVAGHEEGQGIDHGSIPSFTAKTIIVESMRLGSGDRQIYEAVNMPETTLDWQLSRRR